MRSRRQKKECFANQQYTPNKSLDQIKEDYQTKQKNSKYRNESKMRTKSSKRNLQSSSNNEDSQQSQILQIRHGDEMARQHIRPSFLKRWDGISNQLKLTEDQIRQLSPMLRVYWEVKSKNMNAIVFLEFGRMEFFAFQNDAIKLNELFKKKLKKFSKFLMVNFWCKQIQEVKKQLFQMKIPVLIMNEIQDRKYKQQNGLIRRQVVEVITPALHLDQQDSTPRSRLLLSVFYKKGKCAVLILDAESNHFFIEEFQEDSNFHQIRRIFNKYHPVQLIIPHKEHKEISQIARQICNPYINQFEIDSLSIQDQLRLFKVFNPSQLFNQLYSLYQDQINIQQAEEYSFSKFRVVHAISLAWRYLSSLSLLEKIFYEGIFHNLDHKINSSTTFFDSQVYENLQIFRIKSSQQETYAQPGTLMGFLDNCKTIHGRKLLHRWIDQPLSNIEHIVERQQAIKQLFQYAQLHQKHNQLMKYDRLQKRLGDIYHWVSRTYEKGKNILTRYINPQKQYDIRKNPAVNKLRELISILALIQEYQIFLKTLQKYQIRSNLLQKFVKLKEIQNIHNFSIEEINKIEGIPQIAYICDILMRRIHYDELTGNIEPMPGQNQVFDQQKKQVDRLNFELDKHLQKWKEYFKTDKITFVSVRAKNQIQIPKMAIKRAQPNKDLIYSSEVANFIRYTTHQTSILSQQIMEHEKAIAQSYQPFLQEIVDHFCRYKFLWNLYIKSMSNLDVLMSLAEAAKKMPIKCLPIFKKGINVKNGYHVNLLSVKEEIVPNSICLKEEERVLLLTGPNMGGKSTFLKQICTYAILAQIGSYIPAQHYSSIIYDQIFCRMGASDRIYQGKSTFYVELQQTKRCLSKATSNSLVVIDELGRGTSTFDGMAIAQAILDCLIEKIGCMTLYSTHYTQITQKFKENSVVKMMKMGYQSYGEDGKINFTYQLVDGVAERSFANNVGRMVGLPQEILKRAQLRSQKMNEQINNKKAIRQINKMYKMMQANEQKA